MNNFYTRFNQKFVIVFVVSSAQFCLVKIL